MERATCLADRTRAYMIERFLEIYERGKKTNFKLLPRETELCDMLSNEKFIVVNKSRCVGASSTCLAFVSCELCLCAPEEPQSVLIVCDSGLMVDENLKKMKKFLMQFPLFMWGDLFYDSGYDLTLPPENTKVIFEKSSRTCLTLKNGCKIMFRTAEPWALCGVGGVNWIIFDEMAYIRNGRDVYASTIPVLTTGGHVVTISTPSKEDTIHAEMCRLSSLEGFSPQWNGYKLFEMKWYQDPRYNHGLEWHKEDEKIVDEADWQGNVTYNPEKWKKLLEEGYKPWSPWYYNMCKIFKYNEENIVREIDAQWNVAYETNDKTQPTFI